MDLSTLLSTMSKDITSLSLSEVIFGGLIVTVLCMVIVFIVLILLMYIVKAMAFIASDKSKPVAAPPEKLPAVETPVIQAPVAETQVIEIPVIKIDDYDEDAVIAAITAAVQMAAPSDCKIIVKSIERRSDAVPLWTRTES